MEKKTMWQNYSDLVSNCVCNILHQYTTNTTTYLFTLILHLYTTKRLRICSHIPTWPRKGGLGYSSPNSRKPWSHVHLFAHIWARFPKSSFQNCEKRNNNENLKKKTTTTIITQGMLTPSVNRKVDLRHELFLIFFFCILTLTLLV